MKLFNTLSKTIEQIQPSQEKNISVYACGPTVYDFTHLGHLRKYTMDDVLVKTLKHAGYAVKFVQNITDVGHLASDGDSGEDKLEKGAKKFGKSAWDVAKEFEEYFWKSMDAMNNVRPDVSCRATEHIEVQLNMVLELEKKGFTYVIEGDGVYFDTSKLDDYGKLTNLNREKLEAGARVEMIPGKKNATDFALWKFERPGEDRAMVWASPWHGRSFPGWHIECSAMALKYLTNAYNDQNQLTGEAISPIEIHTGGIDHIPVHHTNEIAQAEATTGQKPFVKYWVHHNFLQVEGTKMSKSLGNFYTIDDIQAKGIHPMAFRLLLLTGHYRSEMNFTWDNAKGSQTSYLKLLKQLVQFKQEQERTVLSEDKLTKINEYRQRFFTAIEDDLKTPEAISIMWEVTKSNIPGQDKYDLLIEFDEVLGLQLRNAENVLSIINREQSNQTEIQPNVQGLVNQRQRARDEKNWAEADRLRDEIAALGWRVLDGAEGQRVEKNNTLNS